MPNTTTFPASIAGLNFGSGLIEIAALTALIGSTTAESLVLGNKGAAGLLWGTMSIFGALSVIKACIAAATPDWLRETLGVRSKEVDAALGVALALDDRPVQSRRRLTGVCGVGCKVAIDEQEESTKEGSVETSRQDIYAFNACISGILELIPESDGVQRLYTYILAPDVFRRESAARNMWKDWVAILASSVKVVELCTLWVHDAKVLCLVNGSCWIFFFAASAALQALGLSREYSEAVRDREVDLIAGQLPTPIKTGGQCKLLLGAPQNVRSSKVWCLVWGLGSLVCTASVIASYMTLGSQTSMVIAEWAGFQFLWLGLRSVFYHFAESANRVFHHPILLKRAWKDLDAQFKARVRRIVTALSLYQMHVHPRGLYCYEEDARSMRETYTSMSEYPLSREQREAGAGSITISISEIIGDTLLSSASFLTGTKHETMDLYDTCVVILKIGGTDTAIPAARVMTGTPPPRDPKDVETGFRLLLPPKGGSNIGRDLSWWYWIPCGEHMWLELHTTDMRIIGQRTARVMSDEEVTKHLVSGDFYVSISEAGQLKETVKNSRSGFAALKSLLL